ncbi:cadherin-like domain-containing protein, partial [Vibrio sp. D173a]|uniref:Ig-like domain-containing protein n=1 Tax=Vibrio sp. D173a TaxID=2836349 RepID=UPI00255239D0
PAQLPPQSKTTTVGEIITIEVRGPLTTGYTLDPEVVVLGDGVASGNSENDEITYEAHAQGVTRLVYTMTNDDGSAILVGTVDVAVSRLGNNAPVATDASFRMESDDIESPQTFDLSAYVSDDDDGDEIQLIQVDAWDAEVGLAAQDDFGNLSFTFKPNHAGFHYVTYVVTDHNGGYGVAQVEIEVVDLSAVATWGNI